ncbi:MAG TPA: GWxTD domain-containing protein [Bacteroidota bacterium]
MIRHPLLLISAAFLLQQFAAAQVEMSGDVSYEPPTSFFVDALSFAAPDTAGSRLDVFIQVGYDNLTFVKVGDTYDASYELTVTLLDSSSASVAEQTWSEAIKGLAFDATTTAGASKTSQRVFRIPPGRYQLTVQLRDNESKAGRRFSREVLVPSFTRPGLTLSSIMLVNRLSSQNGKLTLVPNISPNVGTITGPLWLFLEAYEKDAADSVLFRAAVLDKKEDTLAHADTSKRCLPGRNEVFLRLDATTLPVGDFKLIVLATRAGGPIELAATGRPIVVRWHGLPIGTKNLDEAIDQLRYIARDSEMDSLKDAKTTEEKRKLFLAFWKRRDPNPNTPRNERMEDYYARVEYANRHFSHYREGWKTDMGMVYIMFGPPSNVERHPFDPDYKPYEIWSYYDINQNFVFVDETSFGDYRLTTPIWEVWRRSRE